MLAGLGIGAVLAIGNVYAGLKTNWWDSGNVTAAVLGFALCAPAARLGRRPYSLLENNITQTAAGCGGDHAAALGLLGALAGAGSAGHRYPAWGLAPGALALALFGILLAVPLRRRYVIAEPLPVSQRHRHRRGDPGHPRLLGEARRQTRILVVAALVAMASPGFGTGDRR